MDTLILTSLLVLMGISTNQQIFFLAGYLRLAMYRLYTKPASLFLPKGRRCIKKKVSCGDRGCDRVKSSRIMLVFNVGCEQIAQNRIRIFSDSQFAD